MQNVYLELPAKQQVYVVHSWRISMIFCKDKSRIVKGFISSHQRWI